MSIDRSLTYEQVLSRLHELKNERQEYESLWNDIDNKLSSYQGDNGFSNNTPNLGTLSYNTSSSTGEPAFLLRLAASSIGSFIFPETKNSIEFEITGYKSDKQIKQFLSDSGHVVHKILTNPSLPFSAELGAALLDAVKYGTCAMMIGGENSASPLVKAIDLREIYISYDNITGELDEIFRVYTEYRSTAKNPKEKKEVQIIERYCKERSFSGSFTMSQEELPILCQRFVGREFDDENSGRFVYWPIAIGFLYRECGMTYGSGLGVLMIKNVMVLNKFRNTFLYSAEYNAKPTIFVNQTAFPAGVPQSRDESNGVRGKSSESLGITVGIAKLLVGTSPTNPFHVIQANSDLAPLAKQIDEERAAINNMSLLSILAIDPSPNATAEEVRARIQQKLQVLSPIVSSLQEMLDTIVMKILFSNILDDRKAGMEVGGMVRAQMLPDAPDSPLMPLEIKYKNGFAQMADQDVAFKKMSFIQSVGAIAQLKPEVLDTLDLDQVTRDLANLYDLGYTVVEESVVKKIRAQREQMLQQQMQMEAQGGQP